MAKAGKGKYAANLDLYEKFVATNQKVDRKGATMPYTSLNGHMFSFMSKEGKVGLRLPTNERKQFLEKYKINLMQQHGSIMKEYVEQPGMLLEKTQELKEYFDISFAYVASLKPKPTKKKDIKK